MIENIPSLPGTYALFLQATKISNVQIGALGEMVVRPGFYIYIGSAMGPGGLHGRLKHHIHVAKRPHWHIDYLRQATKLSDIWFHESTQRLECIWSHRLMDQQGITIPLKKLGASDCKCQTHLFYSPSYLGAKLSQMIGCPHCVHIRASGDNSQLSLP